MSSIESNSVNIYQANIKCKTEQIQNCSVFIILKKKKHIITNIYWSRIYSKQIQRGDEYTKARRVVIIAITDFEIDITKELKRMETIWNIREKQNPEKVLTDLLEIRIINLKRIREAYQKDKESKKNQWVMFLEDPNSREVQEIMEKNEDVKKAVVTVREMSEDEKMERLAELRQKAIMDEKALYNTGIREGKELGEKIGREAGEKIGEQKGEQKKKIEVIKRMLNENFDNDTIKKIANATDEEIEEAKVTK